MSARILIGDCVASMRGLAAGSINTCVTSPPYFGLRDYGVEGQIGLEATPDAYVARLVEVFREVRRLLRDDGTLWLNLGDSYNAHPAQRKTTDKVGAKQETNVGSNTTGSRHLPGLAAKQLLGIPWRVAFALQADGWWLRQDIIWAKPNPMPESVTDRCTKSHEYLFLLAKSERYYFDQRAIAEPAIHSGRIVKATGNESKNANAGFGSDTKTGFTKNDILVKETRNRRSVWTVTTKPFKGAHFATFPPDLIEPCVLAGSPVGGTVLDPFGGAGTTGLVSQRHGRNAVMCELNPEYAVMARARIDAESPLKDLL